MKVRAVVTVRHTLTRDFRGSQRRFNCTKSSGSPFSQDGPDKKRATSSKRASKWLSPQSRRAFFDNLALKLGILEPEGWYNVTLATVAANGGITVMTKYYGNSMIRALSSVYPEHDWNGWKFRKAPTSFWHSLEHRQQFFEWAAHKLQITAPEDWYLVGSAQIHELGGGALLLHTYQDSVATAMKEIYPTHSWVPWKFQAVPRGFWASETNRKQYFDWLGSQIGIHSPKDWYQVTSETIRENYGAGVLSHYYNDSVYNALEDLYKDHKWERWKFIQQPKISPAKKVIREKLDLGQYIENLARELGITSMDQWYGVCATHLKRKSIFHYLKDGLPAALKEVYPDHPWLPWKFDKAPRGYWADVTNQRRYFDWLRETTCPGSGLEQCYSLTAATIKKNYGGGLLANQFSGSVATAVMSAYPEHNWRPWEFKNGVPKNYWHDAKNVRFYFDTLYADRGFKSMDEWYDVTTETLAENNSGSLLNVYKAYARALLVAYPEHEWRIFKFKTTPAGHWRSMSAQREFFDWIGKKLGIQNYEDWYSIKTSALFEAGAQSLLIAQHHSSIAVALPKIYPEFEWKEWLFASSGVPDGFWDDPTNLRRFLLSIAPSLGALSMEDWYSISAEKVQKHGFGALTRRTLPEALALAFPEHNWEPLRFSRKASDTLSS